MHLIQYCSGLNQYTLLHIMIFKDIKLNLVAFHKEIFESNNRAIV